MKKIFNRLRLKVYPKEELPPPYEENDRDLSRDYAASRELNELGQTPSCEVLDLLANCRVTADDHTDVEYAEIEEMGIWHSTPLTGRHKSKVSLTWVLRDGVDDARPVTEGACVGAKSKQITGADVNRYQRHNQKFNENERQRKCKRTAPREMNDRIVGRKEYYNNYQFKVNSVSEDLFNGGQDTCSEGYSVEAGEHPRRRHRHRHRRRRSKATHSGKFGYDIKDVDWFLSEASMDRPGNIPVVVAYPSVLYQTHGGAQTEMEMPLGTVVNAVFKNKRWLYVQTPHADEGYISYSACLPLGILPNRSNTPQKKTPCWESSTDIYPRPCGNLTDTEKEQLRGRTKSECRYRATSNDKRRSKNTKSLCGERDFDNLYLKTKSISNLNKYDEDWKERGSEVKELCRKKLNIRDSETTRHTLLAMSRDYTGSSLNNTLSVRQGDVVILLQGGDVEADVDSEWFFVRRRDGKQGFIPAEIAGHGYI